MQQLIKGKACLLELPALLQQNAVGEVLFVTGQHLLKDRLFQQLLRNLTIPYRVIHPGNGVLEVNTIPVYKSLDAVIAIGGGKAMDFAKGIIYQNAQPIYFAAVPTTAGSGSEATPIAVFYRDKEKVSLDDPRLLPQAAILDPSLLEKLPPYQKAVSGADALAQCIESAWSVRSSVDSELFSLEGLTIAWRHLYRFVKEPDNLVAEDMLWAAHLAGKAITITRTTGPHALSYYLTAYHDVPHGQAVALTLPLFFLYNNDETHQGQLEKIFAVLDVSSAEEAFTACRQLFHNVSLATTLPALGLETINLDDWLASVNHQRFANNPVAFDGAKLKDLFQRYLL